jgi:hypothetical protein
VSRVPPYLRDRAHDEAALADYDTLAICERADVFLMFETMFTAKIFAGKLHKRHRHIVAHDLLLF